METKTLKAQKRSEIRKNKVKQLRNQGKIPAVIYGLETESTHVSINESEYFGSLKGNFGKNTILDLTIVDGKKEVQEQVITYVVDKDALTRKVIHVDFLRVKEGIPVKVTVPINYNGVAPGTKLGGTLIRKMDSISIKVMPSNIPTHIDVDLSQLNIGDFISAEDVISEGYELVTFPKSILVRVESPRVVQEETEDDVEAAEGEEGAEGEATSADESSDEGSDS